MKHLLSIASLVIAVALALPGLPPENEIGLLDPPSFMDLTVQGLGMRNPSERLEVGPLVARRKAVGADGATLQIMNVTTDNLTDGSWIVVTLHNPNAINATEKQLLKQWVGVFEAGIPANSTVPVKYTLPNMYAGYAETGEAVIKFRLINMRVPFDVVFFDNCTIPKYYYTDTSIRNCVATLRAGPLIFANPGQPLRPATLITGDPHSINIVWTSNSILNQPFLEYRPLPARPLPPFVRPGHGLYTKATVTSAAPYDRTTLCGAPASTFGYFDPGVRHSAVLTGLQTSTWYAYRFGDADSGPSDEYVFWQPPGPDPNANITLITFGDLGRGNQDGTMTWSNYGEPALNTSRRMSSYMEQHNVDGIFHIGDLSYATGFLSIWDTYAEMMTSSISHTPYAVLVGNHESDVTPAQTPPNRAITLFNGTDSGGECSVPTGGWYPMPWKSLDAPWYSYEIGPLHIVGMSSEHDFYIGSPQYKWIEEDLRRVDRKVTPWILFGGHRPMYIDSTYGGKWSSDNDVMDMLIDNLEPLLLKYKVDIAVWGHNHVVQRYCMLNNRSCVQYASQPGNTYTKDNGGIMHLVIGAAGAAFTRNIHNPWLPMTENGFYEYGYSRMRIQGGDTLIWEWLDNDMEPSKVRDSIIIRKSGAATTGNNDNTLSRGAIAGIAVGCSVAGLALIVIIVKFVRRSSYQPVDAIPLTEH